MNTDYEFIRFVEEKPAAGEKVWWTCQNKKSGGDLGIVEWYAPWRQYTFTQADQGILFSAGCLRDIAEFMDQKRASR